MRTDLDINMVPSLAGIRDKCTSRSEGCVSKVVGLTVESTGPCVSVGDMAWIETNKHGEQKWVASEVVGFNDRAVLLMPVEPLGDVKPGARVVPGGRLQARVGYDLCGRVLDGLGRPMDGGPELVDTRPVPIDAAPPNPLDRKRLTSVFSTGVKAIDGLLTCAEGQRLGIFSGSGVGKSVLLGSLARNSSATVNVIALVGERGREVRDFVEACLGEEGLKKSVVVVASSDESALMRVKACSTAMSIAEYFRAQGEKVLLLMDSVTRFAMAQREIGLAVGEPPTTKGYPPSVFGMLARLMERSGNSKDGSITAFYTVLVEADDMNDPIADTARSILDGHIVLSREIAEANRYPAIDVLMSISRVMNDIIPDEHKQDVAKVRSLLSTYRKAEDLINVGAYVAGANPKIDEAVSKIDAINGFLTQPHNLSVSLDDALDELKRAVA